MRYFKDSGDGFYSAGDDVQPFDGWAEITEAEWQVRNPTAQPDPKDSIRENITALLSAKGVSQKWQIESAAASVLALAIAQGLSEPEAYTQRPGYRDAKDLLVQIEALEAQL